MNNAQIPDLTPTQRAPLTQRAPPPKASPLGSEPKRQTPVTLKPVLLNKSAQRFLGTCGTAVILAIVFSAFSAQESDDAISSQLDSSHRTRAVTLAGSFQIDINDATTIELMLLPKIGRKTANAIVLDRHNNGRFGSVEQLTRVPGIGDKTIREIAPFCMTNGSDTGSSPRFSLSSQSSLRDLLSKN